MVAADVANPKGTFASVALAVAWVALRLVVCSAAHEIVVAAGCAAPAVQPGVAERRRAGTLVLLGDAGAALGCDRPNEDVPCPKRDISCPLVAASTTMGV